MYKLEFTLKQHTPIIHFQHHQDGATLRASEVKPKLDKFLRERLKQIKPLVYDKHFDLIDSLSDSRKETNTPSPYKLIVLPVNDDSIEKFIIASYIPRNNIHDYETKGYKILDRTPYFADNASLKVNNLQDSKLGLMLKAGKELKLVFRFFNPQWEEVLVESLPEFFINTNFGSRQSKGFGCFLPSNISLQELENLLKLTFPIAYRSKSFKDLREVFIGIDSVYKNLKSGDRNSDSELRKYFNELRPVREWEKPSIQEKIAEISRLNIRIRSKTSNRQFIRALLGLPEIYEYPKHGGIKAKVKPSIGVAIERYSSPILFKVFEKTVYLTGKENENWEMILNKTFDFEFSQQGRKHGKLEGGIKTPVEFNLIDFLTKADRKSVV